MGAKFTLRARRMANTWIGTFPVATDRGRTVRTMPVRAFLANGWGLQDMISNVWEWTADPFRDADAQDCCGAAPLDNAVVVRGRVLSVRAKSLHPLLPSGTPAPITRDRNSSHRLSLCDVGCASAQGDRLLAGGRAGERTPNNVR